MDDAGSSAQRIRIGLTGLAFAFLLVLLGSVISRSGEEAERASRTPAENQAISEAEAQAEAEPDEPLAKLGVAPGGSETADNSSKAD